MALNVEMVTFDCVDPAQLAEWWAQQFEGETQELIPGEFIAVIRADGPRLGFQKVDDPTPGKNRGRRWRRGGAPAHGGGSDRGRSTQYRRQLPLGGACRPSGQRLLRRRHGVAAAPPRLFP
jgi:hypothetical protein